MNLLTLENIRHQAAVPKLHDMAQQTGCDCVMTYE